jgi:hypothetical protein
MGKWDALVRIVLFSATIPNSGIRDDLCVSILVRIEYMENVGVDSIILTLSCAFFHIAEWFDEAASTDLMRTLT